MTGNGTQGNPYMIYTSDDLLALSGKAVSGEEVFIRLANDINLRDIANFPGIKSSIDFYMNFDGQGFSIRNLTATKTGNGAGLFDCSISGTVKNVRLKNCSITGLGYTAAFAYRIGNSAVASLMENVQISGNISSTSENASGFSHEGGRLIFDSCSSQMLITGQRYVVGFCMNLDPGTANATTFIRCISSCNLFGQEAMGFSRGSTSASTTTVTFLNCISACNLTGKYDVFSFKSRNTSNPPSTNHYFSYSRCVCHTTLTSGTFTIYGLSSTSASRISSYYDKDILVSPSVPAGVNVRIFDYGTDFVGGIGIETSQLKDKNFLIKQGWAF